MAIECVCVLTWAPMFDLDGFLTLVACFEEHFLTSRNPLSGPLEELAHTHPEQVSASCSHLSRGRGGMFMFSQLEGGWGVGKPCA